MTLKSYMDGQFWVIGPRDDRVYMDMSIYKGVGGQTTMQAPPPIPTTGMKTGRVFVFGDSQTAGMVKPLKDYYAGLGYAPENIIIQEGKTFKVGAAYWDISNYIRKIDKGPDPFRDGDVVWIASVGGNVSGYPNHPSSLQTHLLGSNGALTQLQNRGIQIGVTGLPAGQGAGDEIVAKRKSVEDNQAKAFAEAGIPYQSVFEDSKSWKPGKTTHYSKEGRRAYSKYLTDSLAGADIPKASAVSAPGTSGTPAPTPRVAGNVGAKSPEVVVGEVAAGEGTERQKMASLKRVLEGEKDKARPEAEIAAAPASTASGTLSQKPKSSDLIRQLESDMQAERVDREGSTEEDLTGNIKPVSNKGKNIAAASTPGTPTQVTPAPATAAAPVAEDLSKIPKAMQKYDATVSRYSKAYGVPKAMMYSIMSIESGGKREDAGLARYKKLQAFKKENANLPRAEQKAKWKSLPENDTNFKRSFDQGLGIMQSLRGTFVDTSKRMQRAGIKLDYDPTNPTMDQHLNAENNIRASAFMLRNKMDLVRKEYPESRKDQEQVVHYASIAYFAGDGGRRSHVRNMTKEHGKNFRTWPVVPGGHTSGGYANKAVSNYRKYNSGGSPKLTDTSATPPPINTKVVRSSPAPKAPAPAPKAPKSVNVAATPADGTTGPPSPTFSGQPRDTKRSKVPRSKPKPGRKTPKSTGYSEYVPAKLVPPGTYEGERTDLPPRRPGDHPTKYNGISRKRTRGTQKTSHFGVYRRDPKEKEAYEESLRKKSPKAVVRKRVRPQDSPQDKAESPQFMESLKKPDYKWNASKETPVPKKEPVLKEKPVPKKESVPKKKPVLELDTILNKSKVQTGELTAVPSPIRGSKFKTESFVPVNKNNRHRAS